MKLSDETITILKNFSSINSNIVFKVGEPIKTISEAKNILAIGPKLDFDHEKDFGIYDLPEFLGALNLFNEPSFEFGADYKSVKIVEGSKSINYFFSSTEFLTHPTKDIQMPEVKVSFTITDEDVASLRQAASALGLTNIVVEGDGTDVKVYVTNSSDPTSNSFTIEIGNVEHEQGVPFKFVSNISDLKMISDDYVVEYSSKFISRFVGVNKKIQYFIGLDNKASTYGA
jgi:hypothetical protein